MKKAVVLLAVAAVVVFPVAGAFAKSWDGGGTDNYWNTAENWDPDGVPTSSDSVSFSTDDVAELHGSAESSGFRMYRNSTLDVYTGAAYQQYGSGEAHLCGGSGLPTGPWSVITQHGGTMNFSWHLRLGYHSISGTNTIQSRGRYIISGGTLTVSRAITVGVAYGSYPDDTCLGEFIVVGGDADRISASGLVVDDSTYDSDDNPGYSGPPLRSKLEFQFDGDDDPIQQIDISGNVTLGGILKITGSAPAGTYTILTYGGDLTLSDNFDAQLPAGWSIDYGTGSNSAITVTVPEPATLVLLGLGGCLVLLRRKK